MDIITSTIALVNTLRYGDIMDEKLNRQRWLTAGLQALAEEGPEGLRIMPIAEQLGVTKGSFYWHFKNLEEYRTALLEEWEQSYTQEAIQCLEKDNNDPHTKLRTWIIGAAYSDFKLDRAIRSWSLNNPAVREVRARVDLERINYLAKLLRGVGWSKDEALTLGQWAYCAWVGYAALDGPVTTEKQLKLILSILLPK
ncbi:MAG: TetR/AcrR family transcriptional regulator [Burkholderiales bacterium]|nr:TetR/AcrR family transcriptional regulator [Burkholderiales bacterium]